MERRVSDYNLRPLPSRLALSNLTVVPSQDMRITPSVPFPTVETLPNTVNTTPYDNSKYGGASAADSRVATPSLQTSAGSAELFCPPGGESSNLAPSARPERIGALLDCSSSTGAPATATSSTPATGAIPKHHSGRYEMLLTAKSLSALVDEVCNIPDLGTDPQKQDAVRVGLLKEYPQFMSRLQKCLDNPIIYKHEPVFLKAMADLRLTAEEALLKVGLRAVNGHVSRQEVRRPANSVYPDNNSVASSSSSKAASTASQMKVNLILSKAKKKARAEAMAERENIRLKLHNLKREEAAREAELKQMQLDLRFKEESLRAQAEALELQTEEHADELALANFETLEWDSPNVEATPPLRLLEPPIASPAVASPASASHGQSGMVNPLVVDTSAPLNFGSASVPSISIAGDAGHSKYSQSGRAPIPHVFDPHENNKIEDLGSSCPVSAAAGETPFYLSGVDGQVSAKLAREPSSAKSPPSCDYVYSRCPTSELIDFHAREVHWADDVRDRPEARDEAKPTLDNHYSSFGGRPNASLPSNPGFVKRPPHSHAQRSHISTHSLGANTAGGRSSVGCQGSSTGGNLNFVDSNPSLLQNGGPAYNLPPIQLELGGLSELLKQSRIPQGEPPVFSGSRLEEYLPFRSAFEALVAENCYSDEQRYRLLLKYTAGDAQGLVHSCHGPDISVAYQESLKQLQSRYGDPFKLAQYFVDKLHSWPPLRDNSVDGIANLSLFLTRIRNMMSRGQEWQQLNSSRELMEFAEKLPFRMKRAWSEKVCSLQRNGRLAGFADLADVIQKEADILSCPGVAQLLAAKGSPSARSVARSANLKPAKAMTTHVAEIEDQTSSNCLLTDASTFEGNFDRTTQTANPSSPSPPQATKKCSYCSRIGHILYKCRSFSAADLETRKDWVKNNKLCHKCLRLGHFARSCKIRVHCDVCQSSEHVTVMHEDSPVTGANAIALAVKRSFPKKSWSPVVPIEVLAPNGSSCYTYAALDTWASSSFVSAALASKLGMVGEPEPLRLTTVAGKDLHLKSSLLTGFSVRAIDGDYDYLLSDLYEIESWPFKSSDIPSNAVWQSFGHLKQIYRPSVVADIGLLLGQSDGNLLKVLETVSGPSHEPFATRCVLGWALQGSMKSEESNDRCCLSTSVEKQSRHRQTQLLDQCKFDPSHGLESLYRSEFHDPHPNLKGNSREDKIWKDRVLSSLCYQGQKLQIDLPFRDPQVTMPCNRAQAYFCAKQLHSRLKKDSVLKKAYVDFMQKMIINGQLELIPRAQNDGPSGRVWHLVHHPVWHKMKGKLRVVFDCSRRCRGVSLNDVLLQGPDLLNNLVGVLLRFREHPVAFAGDIEQMFLQLKVPPAHSDFMRVFWWPDGDLDGEPVLYRMTCHTFGAISSPSIANFAVKRAADLAEEHSNTAKEALSHGAYMDDVLCSAPSVQEARNILSIVRDSAAAVGFNLRGIVSNSREFLSGVQEEIVSPVCKDLDLGSESSPQDRVLGVAWLIDIDAFSYRPNIPEFLGSTSKRQLLSALSSVFDPLGIIVPTIVQMRSLFQNICALGTQWDDPLPRDAESVWRVWLQEVPMLKKLHVQRCITLPDTLVSDYQLHVFADGSERAFAAAAYFRQKLPCGKVVCTLLMAKARQVPVSRGAYTTIPRIELAAAKLAVSLAVQIKGELSLSLNSVRFWSDSLTVLHYIRNTTSRFQRFVANRVDFVLQFSSPEDWSFVPGKLNPADLASRGCSISKLISSKEWFPGPPFLREPVIPSFEEPVREVVPETRSHTVLAVNALALDAAGKLLDTTSLWSRMIRRLYAFDNFCNLVLKKESLPYPPPGSKMKDLEKRIWRFSQARSFGSQLTVLKTNMPLARGDKLARLSPHLMEDLLCVGSRVQIDCVESSNPIILSSDDHVVRVYIKKLHIDYKHPGKAHMTALLNERFYIFGLSRFLAKLLKSCKSCIRINGKPENPIMAPLPPARTNPVPRPFTDTGVDFFGPLTIAQGRKSVKAYGVLFTCLASRAVHLEIAYSLNVSSFLAAFRRFVCRRGCPSTVYSDQGTNLVGANTVMRKEVASLDKTAIGNYAFERKIHWHFSPPKASHFGGIWERLIRSTRKILMATLCDIRRLLTAEELETLMCEAEFILNSRPLTPVSAESTDMGPITPNHLLMGASSPAYAISDESSNLKYYQERWKLVQHLADNFWRRWRREYLPTLRLRPKWLKRQRNLEAGDLVLVVDGDAPRGSWPTALIERTHPSKDGVVRKATVRIVRPSGSDVSILERPVHKLVLVYKWADLQTSE